jgi:NADH:ubiquinone oxidoreductase subunit 2 (subunit N)
MTRTATKRRNRNRRLITLAWIVGTATLLIVLLYKEKADWLYVLATLGLTALLVIVAFADLRGKHGKVDEASLGDDSAAIGDGITTLASPTAATAVSDFRGAKTRKARKK